MSTSQLLPLYQCHKQVRAAKIKEIAHKPNPDATGRSAASSYGATITLSDDRYAKFDVSPEYVNKHEPEPGGYYVVYEDGYTSYSPAAAFENGYSPVLAMAQQNSLVESAGAMVGASAAISGQQRISHREELERLLVSGASAQIAHEPDKAAAIAKGIKTVLDELAPKMASGIVIPPIGSPSAGATAASLSLHVIDPGHDSQERCIQKHSDERSTKTGMDLAAHDAVTGLALRGLKEVAPTDSHASAVLYPAIERAMEELGTLHPAFSFAVNRAFNHLHDAFWSECPAPASAAPKRPDFPGV